MYTFAKDRLRDFRHSASLVSDRGPLVRS